MMRRRLMIAALSGSLLLGLSVGVGACVLGAPRFEGPTSDHFDGDTFHNVPPSRHAGFTDFFKWQLDRDRGAWREWTDRPIGKKPPERVGKGQMRVTFVNHATVLVQMDGLNLLTDPIWSMRASPFTWIGPHRVRRPGIRFEDLPPIDAVLVSHNHYDHFDVATLRRLAEAHSPKIFVGLGNDAILAREGIPGGVEVDWWDRKALSPDVTLVSVPVQHFSGRSLTDRDHTLWTGYAVEGPSGRLYFAGDTGYGSHFAEARKRLGPIRVALLPIGAFRPRWFMHTVHVSPAEAVMAHRDLQAETSVAIHFGTFALGDDGQHEPVRELARALGQAGIPRSRFWVMAFGEGRDVPIHGVDQYDEVHVH